MPDRIDEDQVGLVEPGLLVVDQLEGRRRHAAVGLHLHPPRADRAQVQPDRRGARAAVEREHQRPLRAGVVERVGDEEDVGLDLVSLAVADAASGRSVAV